LDICAIISRLSIQRRHYQQLGSVGDYNFDIGCDVGCGYAAVFSSVFDLHFEENDILVSDGEV